jgi:hypothetical protein
MPTPVEKNHMPTVEGNITVLPPTEQTPVRPPTKAVPPPPPREVNKIQDPPKDLPDNSFTRNQDHLDTEAMPAVEQQHSVPLQKEDLYPFMPPGPPPETKASVMPTPVEKNHMSTVEGNITVLAPTEQTPIRPPTRAIPPPPPPEVNKKQDPPQDPPFYNSFTRNQDHLAMEAIPAVEQQHSVPLQKEDLYRFMPPSWVAQAKPASSGKADPPDDPPMASSKRQPLEKEVRDEPSADDEQDTKHTEAPVPMVEDMIPSMDIKAGAQLVPEQSLAKPALENDHVGDHKEEIASSNPNNHDNNSRGNQRDWLKREISRRTLESEASTSRLADPPEGSHRRNQSSSEASPKPSSGDPPEARNPVSRSDVSSVSTEESSESTESVESEEFERLNDLPRSIYFCLNEEEEAISQVKDPSCFHSRKNHAEESTINTSLHKLELFPKTGYVGASQAKIPPSKKEFAQECANDVTNETFAETPILSEDGIDDDDQLEAAVIKGTIEATVNREEPSHGTEKPSGHKGAINGNESMETPEDMFVETPRASNHGVHGDQLESMKAPVDHKAEFARNALKRTADSSRENYNYFAAQKAQKQKEFEAFLKQQRKAAVQKETVNANHNDDGSYSGKNGQKRIIPKSITSMEGSTVSQLEPPRMPQSYPPVVKRNPASQASTSRSPEHHIDSSRSSSPSIVVPKKSSVLDSDSCSSDDSDSSSSDDSSSSSSSSSTSSSSSSDSSSESDTSSSSSEEDQETDGDDDSSVEKKKKKKTTRRREKEAKKEPTPRRGRSVEKKRKQEHRNKSKDRLMAKSSEVRKSKEKKNGKLESEEKKKRVSRPSVSKTRQRSTSGDRLNNKSWNTTSTSTTKSWKTMLEECGNSKEKLDYKPEKTRISKKVEKPARSARKELEAARTSRKLDREKAARKLEKEKSSRKLEKEKSSIKLEKKKSSRSLDKSSRSLGKSSRSLDIKPSRKPDKVLKRQLKRANSEEKLGRSSSPKRQLKSVKSVKSSRKLERSSSSPPVRKLEKQKSLTKKVIKEKSSRRLSEDKPKSARRSSKSTERSSYQSDQERKKPSKSKKDKEHEFSIMITSGARPGKSRT